MTKYIGPGWDLVSKCSALRRRYRDAIRSAAGQEVLFLHLAGPRALVAGRMQARQGHFMPPSLLESQYAALEPLEPDEPGFTLAIDATPEAIVSKALCRIGLPGQLGTCA